MRRVQREISSETKNLETLISSKRAAEKKKNVEQILIFAIVLFCLSTLYIVFSSKEGDSKPTDGSNVVERTKDKTEPRSKTIKLK